MKYDYSNLYQKNLLFLKKRPPLKKALPILDKIMMSIFFIAYTVFLIYVLKKDISAVEQMKNVFIPLICLFIVSVLQIAIDRPRPYSEKGANIVPLVKKRSQGHSFPSRHLASAAVISMTLLCASFPLGILFLLFTALLGYIRFSLGLHYPEDLVSGAILGILCGCFLFVF